MHSSAHLNPSWLQVKHACWSEGQEVPYGHLANTLAACDSTTKRLAIADALTNCFRCVSLWLLCNGLAFVVLFNAA